MWQAQGRTRSHPMHIATQKLQCHHQQRQWQLDGECCEASRSVVPREEVAPREVGSVAEDSAVVVED